MSSGAVAVDIETSGRDEDVSITTNLSSIDSFYTLVQGKVLTQTCMLQRNKDRRMMLFRHKLFIIYFSDKKPNCVFCYTNCFPQHFPLAKVNAPWNHCVSICTNLHLTILIESQTFLLTLYIREHILTITSCLFTCILAAYWLFISHCKALIMPYST